MWTSSSCMRVNAFVLTTKELFGFRASIEAVSVLRVGRPITTRIKIADTHYNKVLQSLIPSTLSVSCLFYRTHCAVVQMSKCCEVSSTAVFFLQYIHRFSGCSSVKKHWLHFLFIRMLNLPKIVQIIRSHIAKNIIRVACSGYSTRTM